MIQFALSGNGAAKPSPPSAGRPHRRSVTTGKLITGSSKKILDCLIISEQLAIGHNFLQSLHIDSFQTIFTGRVKTARWTVNPSSGARCANKLWCRLNTYLFFYLLFNVKISSFFCSSNQNIYLKGLYVNFTFNHKHYWNHG